MEALEDDCHTLFLGHNSFFFLLMALGVELSLTLATQALYNLSHAISKNPLVMFEIDSQFVPGLAWIMVLFMLPHVALACATVPSH
jgi:hypothetical protein